MIISIILFVIFGVLYYIIQNLLRKVEKLEEKIIDRDNSLFLFKQEFKLLIKQMKDIDERGMFEKDDDVGVVFSRLTELVYECEKEINKIYDDSGDRQ